MVSDLEAGWQRMATAGSMKTLARHVMGRAVLAVQLMALIVLTFKLSAGAVLLEVSRWWHMQCDTVRAISDSKA
jgi:hypothetical protein